MGLSFWACCSFEINILWNKKLWELLTKNLRPLRICYKSRREEKHPNLKWFWELSRHFFIIFPGRKPIKSIKYQKFRIRNMYKNCAPWQRGIIITAYRITISLQTHFSFSSILSHFRISITWGLFEHEMKGKDCWVKYFPISQYHWLSVFFWNIKLLFHWGIIGKSLRSLGEKIKCMLILLMMRAHIVGWKRSQLTIDATLKDCAINIWWLSSNFEMLKLSTSASFTWIGGWIDEQSFLPEKKPSFLHEKKPRENPIFQAVLQAKRKRHINSFYRKENLKRFKYANTDTFCVWQYLNVKNIKQCQTLQYGKYIDWFRNENKDKEKKNRRSYAAWQKEKVKVKEGKRLIVADTIVWGDAE